ncbi:hypothetical protein XA68_10034 [Ophiocordyceps unilateralis]|uniref:Ribosome biogenesis protein SLX9 n=1 Tax=Ophiocordyceps unilateralis TaxID=268505 RepID=A0A2A9PVB9_OPHUN|nr:hypothetical protein XA68_10034 [Ophiocordyceps unilateralis]
MASLPTKNATHTVQAPTAPTQPTRQRLSARAHRQARLSGASHPLFPQKTFRQAAAVTDTFLSTKRDKRMIRQSAFLSRVALSSASRVVKPSSRRRRRHHRPNNQVLESLKSLAEALPRLEDGRHDTAAHRHRSLPSKPGALKRRQRIVGGEMERFRASMARLATVAVGDTIGAQKTPPDGGDDARQSSVDASADGSPSQPPAVAGRWAALRGYISATMEQAPAFARKS